MSAAVQHLDGFGDAFESAFARLQVSVLDACGRAQPWPAKVAAGVQAAVDFAVADPAAARVLTVQALAERPDGAGRYLRLIDHFSELLRAEAPRDERRPATTEEALIGGLATIVADQVREEDLGRLSGLTSELTELTLVPYLGRAEARRWGRGQA